MTAASPDRPAEPTDLAGAGRRASLEGQRVVVFGGSSGIGLATARLAAVRGAEVVIVARDAAKLAMAQGRVKSARTAALDATDHAAVEEFFASLGRIDHLVMSVATGGGAGRLRDLDLDVLRRAIETKLVAYLATLRAALPRLRADGSACLVAAASARMAAPGTVGLAASNGAVVAAVPPLAAELAPLRVNAVCPGIVKTPIFDRWPVAIREEFMNRAGAIPVGRAGEPEEVAEVIVLCLENAFMTGAVLDIDGGARLRM